MRLEVAGEEIAAYGDVGGRCLLLHGAGEDAALFAEQLHGVAGTWAVDLPGHGASAGSGRDGIEEYAQIVLALLDHYATAPTVLGGHSMGGAIALSCSLAAPGRLAGLALISTGGRLRVHPDLLSALSASDEMPAPFRDALVAEGPADGMLARMAQPRPGVRHKDFLACNAFDVLARLGEIRLPALVLVGSRDAYTPRKYAETLAQGLQGELVVVEGAGHMLPLEAPGAVSLALARFLS